MGTIRYGARSEAELQRGRPGASGTGFVSTLLTAVYETDAEVVAAVLPPPLEPSGEPLVRVTMATVDLGNDMAPIGAGTFAVQARHGVTVGNYPLVMPMTTEQAVVGGREVYGEPKKLGEVGVERSGDTVRGWFARMGVTFAEITGTVTGELPLPADETRVDFYFKALPSPDGKGFDSEPALVYCHRTEATEALSAVEGTVILRDSPYDPVADLPVRAVLSIELARRSSGQRGEIVERVPGEWLAPYLHQRYDNPAPRREG